MFELKGHLLNMLTETLFYEKDNKDAYQPIDEVLESVDYFNAPGVIKDAIILRILPITFKDAARSWLKSLLLGTITTWNNLKEQFIQQCNPPSKIAKLKMKILNFQQFDGETIYEAWECYKVMIRNWTQHDLNMKQEMSTLYNGINVCTR